jgi:hypothetical protein
MAVLVLVLESLLVCVRVRVNVVAVAVCVLVLLVLVVVSIAFHGRTRRALVCLLSRAIGTGPGDGEVRKARLVAELLPDALANRVQLLGENRPNRAAELAVQILPLAVAVKCVEASAVAEVDMVHEPVALEGLKVAMYRGQVEASLTGDVSGRHGTAGREQRLQSESPRGRDPEPSIAQRGDRLGEVADRQRHGVGGACHSGSVFQREAVRLDRLTRMSVLIADAP